MFSSSDNKQSWADLACLDDSKDGINLFMKHALSVTTFQPETIQEEQQQQQPTPESSSNEHTQRPSSHRNPWNLGALTKKNKKDDDNKEDGNSKDDDDDTMQVEPSSASRSSSSSDSAAAPTSTKHTKNPWTKPIALPAATVDNNSQQQQTHNKPSTKTTNNNNKPSTKTTNKAATSVQADKPTSTTSPRSKPFAWGTPRNDNNTAVGTPEPSNQSSNNTTDSHMNGNAENVAPTNNSQSQQQSLRKLAHQTHQRRLMWASESTASSTDSPWKAALVGAQAPPANQQPSRSFKSGSPFTLDKRKTVNNGSNTARKRLACDITRTPTNRAEKHGGQDNDRGKTSGMAPQQLSFGNDTQQKLSARVQQGDQKKICSRTPTETERTTSALDSKRTWAAVANPVAAMAAAAAVESNKDVDMESKDGDSVASSTATPVNSKGLPIQPIEELTSARIDKRQRQIDIGKSTDGYKRYTAMVKKSERRSRRKVKGAPACPNTPEKGEKISKRSWDAQVRQWRRALHEWDPPGTTTEAADDKAQGTRPSSNSCSSDASSVKSSCKDPSGNVETKTDDVELAPQQNKTTMARNKRVAALQDGACARRMTGSKSSGCSTPESAKNKKLVPLSSVVTPIRKTVA